MITEGRVTCTWSYEGTKFSRVVLRDGRTIYGTVEKYRTFPLMVEECKGVFHVDRREYEVFRQGNTRHIVWIASLRDGCVVWNTPISRISKRSEVLKSLKNEIRKNVLFCEIFRLKNTRESNITITEGRRVVSVNNRDTVLTDDEKAGGNVVSDHLFDSWFGESVSKSSVLEDMMAGRDVQEVREEVERIILSHDKDYVWYVNFIVEMISNMFLT